MSPIRDTSYVTYSLWIVAESAFTCHRFGHGMSGIPDMACVRFSKGREGMTDVITVEKIDRAVNAPVGKKRFAQVYSKGWHTIRDIGENPMALKVYTFLAEHCDHLNALVCSIEVMAEEFSCSGRTIMRATKWLEERRHIVIVKIGTANAYVLDPADLWKNYDQYKGYCAFHAKTLASKAQNKLLKQRLSHMMTGQKDLFEETVN
jgi:hypothetical protein